MRWGQRTHRIRLESRRGQDPIDDVQCAERHDDVALQYGQTLDGKPITVWGCRHHIARDGFRWRGDQVIERHDAADHMGAYKALQRLAISQEPLQIRRIHRSKGPITRSKQSDRPSPNDAGQPVVKFGPPLKEGRSQSPQLVIGELQRLQVGFCRPDCRPHRRRSHHRQRRGSAICRVHSGPDR